MVGRPVVVRVALVGRFAGALMLLVRAVVGAMVAVAAVSAAVGVKLVRRKVKPACVVAVEAT